MPSRFHRRFKQSGFPRLQSEFGESIVYRPRKGGRRPVIAIIERQPVEFYDNAGNVVVAAFAVRLKHDCTEGVLASEVDTGGDTIELIKELGGTKKEPVTVLKILSQDSAVIQLACK